jgi:hypothetical protein
VAKIMFYIGRKKSPISIFSCVNKSSNKFRRHSVPSCTQVTLDAMRIPWSELCPVSSPFHGVILEMQAYPLVQIDLPIMFGDRANFR